MKDNTTAANAATPQADPPALLKYEVTCDGPLKVGGVLAWRGARLNLTQAQADAINAAQPASVRFLGI